MFSSSRSVPILIQCIAVVLYLPFKHLSDWTSCAAIRLLCMGKLNNVSREQCGLFVVCVFVCMSACNFLFVLLHLINVSEIVTGDDYHCKMYPIHKKKQ